MNELEIILYQPIHKIVAGNLPSGLILSYLLSKLSNTQNDYITLTNNQISKETLLSNASISKAKQRLKNLPFLNIEIIKEYNEYNLVIGIITKYSINWELYRDYIKELINE